MASTTPQDIKKQKKESKGSFAPFLFSILFIAFGVLLILKVLNLQYSFLNNSFVKLIPESAMLLISGVGSVFGGIYLFYKKYLYRQRIVYRG